MDPSVKDTAIMDAVIGVKDDVQLVLLLLLDVMLSIRARHVGLLFESVKGTKELLEQF